MIFDWADYAYKIDDSNIDCGRILITTCDPYIHEYVDPCDIVSDCLNNIGRPSIDRCSMINDIPGATSGAFLRIDNTGNCVEFIDPSSVFSAYNTDRLVAVDSSDSAGYLEDKIISSDGSVIISNTGSALDLSMGGATTFLELSDTPSTYSGHDGDVVKVSGNQIVFVSDDKSQRGVAYLNDDQVISGSPNDVRWFFCNTSYYEGNPAFPGSVGTGVGTAYYIEVQKTGMYHVWFNGGITVNRGVNAIKMAVLSTQSGDKKIILNSKLGVRPNGMPIVDEEIGQTHYISSFSEKGLVRLTAGTKLFLLIRVDSNAGNNVTPEIVIEGKTHVIGDFSGSGLEVLANKYCGTQLGIARYSEITHNAI